MTGKTPADFLSYKLPVIGIEPGSPLYKAVQDAYIKEEADKQSK
jgi:hypothetical protein